MNRLHVGQATHLDALSVFPVWNESAGERRYAVDPEALQVGELDRGPSVSRLSATNLGLRDLLVLEGQLFESGMQHRMATRSTVVPAGRSVEVDVACVESGRWSGGGEHGTAGRRATPFVRSGFTNDLLGGQSEVWRRVATYDTGADAAGTGSLVGHLDRTRDDIERLVEQVRPLVGQSGVLVGIAGHPVMLEVFDDPCTLAEQLGSIVRAAGLDALGRPDEPTPGRRARRMVARLERLHPTHHERGDGWSYETGASAALDVAVLRHRHRTVHLRATSRHHPVLARE